MLHDSVGVLRYGSDPYKLFLEVDPGIAAFYRAMIPKWITTNPQRYAPHISVVRNEIPPRMDLWGKYEGCEVEFRYENVVYNGTVYYWLNAFSSRLEEIRVEMGLPVSSPYTRPPDGFLQCFHITLGNLKGLS